MVDEGASPLPASREALAQARRVLDALAFKSNSIQDYRDHVPYVLDRLDNVWRTIDAESKGRRTHEFGGWWKEQQTGNRHTIKTLRNAELKRGEQSTRAVQYLRTPGYIEVGDDGRITAHDEDGTELPRGPDGSLQMPPITVEQHTERVEWMFAVSALDGRPVQDVLEIVYGRLASQVLPEAERLLSAEVD